MTKDSAHQATRVKETGDCLQVTVSVPSAQRELLADFVTQRFAESVELLDNLKGGQAGVRFYVSPGSGLNFERELLEFSRSAFPGSAPPVVETEKVESTDWALRFRESVKAEIIDDTILVRPTWIDPGAGEGIETEIIIDPKMAFGTGSHETTRLCMRALKATVRPGYRVADIGCGSGILSILAAKLGAAHVTALDIDSLAIENCRENCALNDTDKVVEIQRGSVELLESDSAYDIVVCNIILSGLAPLLDSMLKATRAGGRLILSGLLINDSDTIDEALKNTDASGWEITRDGEWLAVVVTAGALSDDGACG